ncbi:HNH endonuclease [Arthrobacter sp. YA7-1]|uniref:HNH endonuclease n=1 Tax=Arthrobacter sp. YA7-1 TaxID=2987701 RepID=UPI0039B4F63F
MVPEGANTALWLTHRVAWNLLQGGHKPGLELDHRTCKRRDCANPLHLEAVTSRENQRRKRRGPDKGWVNTDAANNACVTEFAESHGLPLANGKRQHHTSSGVANRPRPPYQERTICPDRPLPKFPARKSGT